jgi:hypothetical protein
VSRERPIKPLQPTIGARPVTNDTWRRSRLSGIVSPIAIHWNGRAFSVDTPRNTKAQRHEE